MQHPCWTLTETIVGRVYPQIQAWAKSPDQVLGLSSVPGLAAEMIAECVRDRTRSLPTALVAKGAKLSDLLCSASISFYGLLVSTRMRSLLERFSMPEHCFIRAPLEDRGKAIDDYWFLHSNTELAITEEAAPTEVEAIINSDPTLASLDLFHLERPARYAYWFVSQSLRSAVEEAKLTGIRFGTAKLFR